MKNKIEPDFGQRLLMGNPGIKKLGAFICRFVGHNKVAVATTGNPNTFSVCKRCNLQELLK